MIDIQWKGKVGYGDIVSPICYAHNLSYKLGTRVDLTFRWDGDSQYKVDARDPETLWERASFLSSRCEKDRTNVNVIHRFNSPLSINHTNYDWDVVGKDMFHNYWVPAESKKREPELIVINSTEGNIQSLKDYGKEWKDPAANDWLFIKVALKEKGYDVVVVDYRTPINVLWDLLQRAAGFVGYHGTAAWVARLCHTPSVLFSAGGKLSQRAFFNACIVEKSELVPKTIDNILPLLSKSLAASEVARDHYFREYTIPTRTLRHLHYGKNQGL